MLRAEVLETMWYGCVTWSPCLCHYHTLRRAHPSFLTRYIGWQKNNPTDHPISYLGILMEMGSESIEVIILSSPILFAGHVSRIVDTKLPKCVMFGELMGSTGCGGVQEKEWKGYLLDDLRAFGTDADK